MKKLLLGLTLLASVSASASSLNDIREEFMHNNDNQTDMNVICGLEQVKLSSIGYAVAGANPLEVKRDLLSEGIEGVVTCDFEDGIAIGYKFKGENKALIFNKL